MKKGFTLVELLAVIVILGLLMTIAIPAVLTVSKNVKKKSYETKIDLIEKSAVSYGDNNLKDQFKKALKESDGDPYDLIRIELIGTGVRVDTDKTATNFFYAKKFKIRDLVEKFDELSYDTTGRCAGTLPGGMQLNECKNYYDNVIVNPVTDNIINNCDIYVYYKNNRVYAIFDKASCDVVGAPSTNSLSAGNEYPDKL